MRARSERIFLKLGCPVKCSIRKIAQKLGFSKSAVHRHKNAIERRNLFPESYFWETKEGGAFLCRLFIAVLFLFGIKNGIGAGTISEFFKLLRIDKHVGSSPTTIKNYSNKIQEMLEEYQKSQQAKQVSAQSLKIVGGADETFFDKMLIVFMDLASGYIFVEDIAEDRCYETWKDKVQNIVEKFGVKIKYIVSDRAKPLIKLAETGFGCLSIPDLFHASYEIVKVFGINLGRKKNAIEKKIQKATAALALLRELGKDVTQQESIVSQLKNEQVIIDSGTSKYQQILHTLSKSVHPFDINNSNRQSSVCVKLLLNQLVEEIRGLQKEQEINDPKKRIEKFCKQIEGIASIIDAWWLWAEESLDSEKLTEEIQQWLLTCLLPAVYWQKQTERTKNPDLKESYLYAFEKAELELEQHPLTASLIHEKEWLSWAEWMVSNFQRTSSAVEGRNGWLSQIHHNGRGLTMKRLRALTIIHNYYLKRSDGTTAAERLFGSKFDDPFEWLVEHLTELPLART